ncbi:hypothetical protein [Aeromonas veronii]|uniref:hypothetical protein n=1 Tax=Aeromonas veronii TaxID=654 RepID=UPI00330A2C83|nr:hypothetical protein [Aeromonas veronii]
MKVKKTAHNIQRLPCCPTLRYGAIGLIISALPAHATESNPTPTLVGHKPVAENVEIDNKTPVLGDTLTVTYVYKDKDDDQESASTIKWRYNGAEVAGENGVSYTPKLNTVTGLGNPCSDFWITAEVTPVSLSGVPNVGNLVESSPVNVELNLPEIPGFTFPETTRRTHAEAIAYCTLKGGRLPTGSELQEVFNKYTSGGVNLDVSQKYGWPQAGFCGGATHGYWTSDVNVDGDPYRVNLNDGGFYDKDDPNIISHVTCTFGVAPPKLPTAVNLTHTASGTADSNGPDFAGRPVVTIDKVTANLSFVPNTDTDLANYRFEWFAGGVTTGVVNDGDNTFIPRVEDQGKPIKVVVTLKP